MKFELSEVDRSWHPLFLKYEERLNLILDSLEGHEITPPRAHIFRAFQQPLSDVRVLILGQDPYPTEGVADGLAFSTNPQNRFPASLRNIFKEYSSDLGYPTPGSSDLSQWSQRGVMLLNRTLTTAVGESNAHLNTGWSDFTLEVAQRLAKNGVVAILWGNNARELAPLFQSKIESVHPSPLSAHRGFFGSRPFTSANELLIQQGKAPINWRI